MKQSWKTLSCVKSELELEPTLNGGQSFRWRKSENGSWMGVFKGRVWLLLQTDCTLLYQYFKSKSENEQLQLRDAASRKRERESLLDEENDEALLRDYFRLDVNLKKYYEMWSESDEHFKSKTPFCGIRLLNQDVVENLFSFICSSNNNISRISSMVEKLCKLYGTEIGKVNGEVHYSFPDIDRLCSPNVEPELRKAGFGYRAKFIYQSACMLEKFGGVKWLKNLKNISYCDAKKELMKLPGIGAKVADCICLMSLGHMEAIPVDTHIFQVASEIYLPHLKGSKSVTDKIYNEISTHFQNLYGDKAGWAHLVLFCSQLKSLKKNKKNKDKTKA